jgi:EF hand
MRYRLSAMAIVFVSLMAIPATAQPPEERREGDRPAGGERPGRPARERIMRAFDKDNDGRLNEEERAAMREQLGDRFEEMRRQMRDAFEERRGDDARQRDGRRDADPQRRPRPQDGNERERDARQRRGPDRRGGPVGPMRGPRERNLDALFGWFDMDGDNMLDRREFAELSEFVSRRRAGPPGGPGGPRVGRRGPDGPPGRGGDQLERRERQRRFGGPNRNDGPGPRAGRDERPPRDEQPRPPRAENPPDPPATPEPQPAAADPI